VASRENPAPFSTVPLEADLPTAVAGLPAAAGVGQILGPEGQSLLIGRAANLRRWAASHLGGGPPVPKGRRPPTDLRPVARHVRFALTTSAFQQRLVFERLMALHVSTDARRDLKRPAYLRIDQGERFPRLTLSQGALDSKGLFGPFRGRRSAERAQRALLQRVPLRPCDYELEPDPASSLGGACVYAQVGSCAAPCLDRVSEDGYRALVTQLTEWLAHPTRRPGDVAEAIPLWVTAVEQSLALVVERGREGLELYPVVAGAVVEEAGTVTPEPDLEAGVRALGWDAPETPRDDVSWLLAWLASSRRPGVYLSVADPQDTVAVATTIRNALTP
jgi:hypothetical protein